MPEKVAFIVNGDFPSAMGERARSLAARLDRNFKVEIAYREQNKLHAIISLFGFLVRLRPRLTYVFDMAFSGVIAGAAYRLIFRNRLIIETGDAIYELSKSIGRGWAGRLLTRSLENFSMWVADHLVVRGSYHRELLEQQKLAVTYLPDGVDLAQFSARDASGLKEELGLNGFLVIGLVGNSVWSEALQMCYGWELVEVVELLKDRRIKGVLIGDGTGIERLKAKCRAAGIDDRVLFLGYRPYERLPELLCAMDVCLSTQTNDLPGKVRTTGKLPLYLATGRYILASRVGEAARVLPDEMLVDYDGIKDLGYPAKLAQRISVLIDHPENLLRAFANTDIAARNFDYRLLGERLNRLITAVLLRTARDPQPDV